MAKFFQKFGWIVALTVVIFLVLIAIFVSSNRSLNISSSQKKSDSNVVTDDKRFTETTQEEKKDDEQEKVESNDRNASKNDEKEELKELLDTIPELAEELNDWVDEKSSLGKEIVEDFCIDEENDNSDVIVQVHQDSPILEEDGKEDKHIKSGNSEESGQK